MAKKKKNWRFSIKKPGFKIRTTQKFLRTNYLVILKDSQKEKLFNDWYKCAMRDTRVPATVTALEEMTKCRYRTIAQREGRTLNFKKNRYFRLVLCHRHWVVLDEIIGQ
ncbi:MAG: hypothetical protein ACPGO5_00440 [Patescibacteria group bacterium]